MPASISPAAASKTDDGEPPHSDRASSVEEGIPIYCAVSSNQKDTSLSESWHAHDPCHIIAELEMKTRAHPEV
jgi:hypothetical protein